MEQLRNRRNLWLDSDLKQIHGADEKLSKIQKTYNFIDRLVKDGDPVMSDRGRRRHGEDLIGYAAGDRLGLLTEVGKSARKKRGIWRPRGPSRQMRDDAGKLWGRAEVGTMEDEADEIVGMMGKLSEKVEKKNECEKK